MVIPKEEEVFTRIKMAKGKAYKKLSPISLGQITRLLRTVRGLKGNVFVVGGLVTEGSTLRDIDIVINNSEDILIIEKALGKFAKRAHFLIQKGEPPSPEFVKITGKYPVSPNLNKSKKIPKDEYANS